MPLVNLLVPTLALAAGAAAAAASYNKFISYDNEVRPLIFIHTGAEHSARSL